MPWNTGRGAALVLLKPWIPFLAVLALGAAVPPDFVNYQGVLRDASGNPLDGSFDMVFRLVDGGTGNEILVDRHDGAIPVTVTGGLFDARVGGGVVSDGAGPGSYTTLSQVFRDFQDVRLRVEVNGETLAPDVRVLSAAYALNATYLDGVFESQFLRSDENDTAIGKIFFAGNPSGPFISQGTIYVSPTAADPDDTLVGVAVNSSERFKIDAEGDTTVQGRVGIGTSAPNTKLEILDGSISLGGSGLGTWGGIWFKSQHLGTSSNHHMILRGEEDASLAESLSIHHRNATPTDDPGSAERVFRVQWDGTTMLGNTAAGATSPPAGGALVTDGPIWNLGNDLFMNQDGPSGTQSIYFHNGSSPSGEFLRWNSAAFELSDQLLVDGWLDVNEASLGLNNDGPDEDGYIFFFEDGGNAGEFLKWDNENDRFQVTDTLLVGGDLSVTGAKNFVQNHPARPDLAIVYSALEGPETATYTRGIARLTGGVARVPLDETFAMVTHPGIGLSAHLTPRETPALLYVESLTTTELVVRAAPDSPQDALFDYVVLGLRIGFENRSALQPRTGDAPVPWTGADERLYAERPDLRAYAPRARFARMDESAGRSAAEDVERATALRAAIGEHDPEAPATQVHRGAGDISFEVVEPTTRVPETAGAVEAEDAPSGPPAPPAVAAHLLMQLSAPAELGDVLSLDPDRAGLLRPSAVQGDPGVIGVATGPAIARADGTWEAAVSSCGVAVARVDAGYGAIRPGDLLTTSPTPGHAMRAVEVRPGSLLGKAVDGLESGTGTIRMVVLVR
jgi:hypothetical protein